MNALLWQGPRQMCIAEVPSPVPVEGEVVVSVEAVGICGSELSGYLGHNSLRIPPLIMGHEFAGTVTNAADGVKIALGTRVTVNPLVSCERCADCKRGRANLCSKRALLGAHRPGAFAEYVAVPAQACIPLSENLDIITGAMAEPLACAVRAIRLAGVGLNSKILIIGAGPIGLLCAAVAHRTGAAQVAISDISPQRRRVAEQWGTDYVFDPAEGSPADVFRRHVDEQGADAVIDAVGLTVTRRQATQSVRRGGSVVLVGLHQTDASFDGNELVRNEIHLTGSFAYTSEDFHDACALLSANFLPDRQSWMDIRPLDEGPASFEELIGSEPEAVKIMLRP